MLDINDVPLEEQWRLTAFEVMKYNPKFRNLEGHYLKKEWTEFEIGKIFDGVELIYEDYKVVEDKYILAFQYLFDYFNCERIQILETKFFLDQSELHNIRDQELEKFYTELKGRMTLNLNEAQMAARLILRGALYGRFYCKGNKEIGVRFGYDYYMFFNVPEKKKEIRTYIEKEIRLFTSR
ncbi:MAG: hypothetical protein IPM86_10730 [Saprospiraceae bacterium]|nr:hypothetical protein [Saprospiraceae bacterium]